jgi:hypothetical protein
MSRRRPRPPKSKRRRPLSWGHCRSRIQLVAGRVSPRRLYSLWKGVTGWKQANDFAAEQSKKLPKLGPEWELFGPNDPSTWLEKRLRPTHECRGLPDEVLVAHLQIEPIRREVEAAENALKQTADIAALRPRGMKNTRSVLRLNEHSALKTKTT